MEEEASINNIAGGLEKVHVSADIKKQERKETVEEKLKKHDEDFQKTFGPHEITGQCYFWRIKLYRALEDVTRAQEDVARAQEACDHKLNKIGKELENMRAIVAVCQVRGEVESLEQLILENLENVPDFFENILKKLLTGSNDFQWKGNPFASPASEQLFKMIGQKYSDKMSFIESMDEARKTNGKFNMAKHVKIWIYGFLFCEHCRMTEIRKNLGEPEPDKITNEHLMEEYYRNVYTCCNDIAQFYSKASDEVHTSGIFVPKQELLGLMEKRISVSTTLRSVLKAIMEVE